MKISRLLCLLAVLTLAPAGWSLRAADAPAQPKYGYTVTLNVPVDEKGNPEPAGITLYSSEDKSPNDVLTKMAIALALKTKFPPHIKDGKAVKYIVRAPFFFPIENDEGPAADNAPKPKVVYGTARQPVYPLDLRTRGVTGGVILELIVDAQGNLASVTSLRSSNPEFEKAAIDCIKQWKFTAAQKDGQPVASRTRFAFVFDTEESMADLKWRIPPRPRLGSLVVIRPDHPISDEDIKAAAAPGAPAPAAPAPEPTPAGK